MSSYVQKVNRTCKRIPVLAPHLPSSAKKTISNYVHIYPSQNYTPTTKGLLVLPKTQHHLIEVVKSLSFVQLFAAPWTCSNSCPLSRWCHQTILSSVILFSCCLQSFPALGSFPVSWLFTSGDQSIGASLSASVFLMNIQGWFLLGLTGLISLLSKGLSRVFSSTKVWRHQFFGTKPFLLSSSHIHMWSVRKP